MLSLEAIALRIAATTVLDGIDCRVEPGQVVALLGPSGSGKTSVLRMIMGLAVPDSGRVVFDAQELSADGRLLVPPERRPFAFLFQDFTLFPHLDVRGNIVLGLRDLPREERRARIEHLTALLGIGDLLRRRIDTLSGGEQQRVALARTLARRPRVLLLDEPFSNLDVMTRRALYRDIRPLLRDAGVAAVLATHDHEEAFFFADRMLVLRDGAVAADGAARAIYDTPATPWLARFTGDANCLDAAALRAWFGAVDADVDTDAVFLVRPEQIRLAAGGDDDPRLVEVAFFGFYTSVVLERAGAPPLGVCLLGRQPFSVGDRVVASLATPPVRMSP